MEGLKIEKNHDEQNAEPVVYCTDCLSLKILTVNGIDYCEKCGSTNTEETDIFNWERMYKTKYGRSFINKK